MATFIGSAALLIAFGALIFAASVARRMDESSPKLTLEKIDKLSRNLESNEQTYQALAEHVEKLVARISALEDGTKLPDLSANTEDSPPPFAPHSDTESE